MMVIDDRDCKNLTCTALLWRIGECARHPLSTDTCYIAVLIFCVKIFLCD